MFKCENCGQSTNPRIKQISEIVETRLASHPPRDRIHNHGEEGYVDDPGGVGTQIVKEIKIGPCCASVLKTVERMFKNAAA